MVTNVYRSAKIHCLYLMHVAVSVCFRDELRWLQMSAINSRLLADRQRQIAYGGASLLAVVHWKFLMEIH